MISDIDVVPNLLNSDHFPLCFSVQAKPETTADKETYTFRNWKTLDVKHFQDKLWLEKELLNPSEDISLEDLVHLYDDTLQKLADEFCPIIQKTVQSRPNQKWFNDELRDLKREKRRAGRQWKKCRSQSSLLTFKTVMKTYRDAKKVRRSNFHKEDLLPIKHDTKAVFKKVSKLTNDKPPNVYPSHESTIDLCEDFANYFTDKIVNIRSEIALDNSKPVNNPPDSPKRYHNMLHDFKKLSIEELKKILFSMNSKSDILDPIPTWLLKLCFDILAPTLLKIINMSLEDAHFPTKLKHATMRPLVKDANEDTEAKKNYRPVSNTAFLSKLLEKCGLQQINIHINENNLHSVYQSAYRPQHSCETVLLDLVNDLQISMSKSQMSALILLDLSAAFDTIDQNLLLERVENDYGIAGNVLAWLKSYLNERTFSVVIKDSSSKQYIMLFGVPQGSLLGPLLFIIYTRELSDIASQYGLKLHVYADDTTLYIEFLPISQRFIAFEVVARCMNDIQNWMKNSFLKLNTGKTNVLFLGSKSQTNLFSDMSLKIDNSAFKSSKDGYVELLGVKIDNNLKMDKQINEVCRSCNYHIQRFQRNRFIFDTDLRLLLMRTFVLTRIDFCNSILIKCEDYLLNKLQMVINSCARFIYDVKKYDHISYYLRKAHILPIKSRIIFKLCTFVFKILNNAAPEYLSQILTLKVIRQLQTKKYDFRSSDDVLLVESFGKDCIADEMCNHWNNLPVTLRYQTDIAKFKKDLKTHLFRHAYS